MVETALVADQASGDRSMANPNTRARPFAAAYRSKCAIVGSVRLCWTRDSLI
jgi:hypothetical protein